MKPSYTLGLLRKKRILKKHCKFTCKSFPDTFLLVPQNCFIFTDSAHFDPECIPTKVSHPYPHLSKVFTHPFRDEALKTYFVLASRHYTVNELLFLTTPSTSFILKIQKGQVSQNVSQLHFMPK